MGCQPSILNLATGFTEILQLKQTIHEYMVLKGGSWKEMIHVHDWNGPVHTLSTPEIGVKCSPKEKH